LVESRKAVLGRATCCHLRRRINGEVDGL
jgi:hypothetical protein